MSGGGYFKHDFFHRVQGGFHDDAEILFPKRQTLHNGVIHHVHDRIDAALDMTDHAHGGSHVGDGVGHGYDRNEVVIRCGAWAMVIKDRFGKRVRYLPLPTDVIADFGVIEAENPIFCAQEGLVAGSHKFVEQAFAVQHRSVEHQFADIVDEPD